MRLRCVNCEALNSGDAWKCAVCDYAPLEVYDEAEAEEGDSDSDEGAEGSADWPDTA